MITQKTTTMAIKSISGLAPIYLSNLLTKISILEIHNLRNSETDLLAPCTKTSKGQKSFSFIESMFWNKLQHNVQNVKFGYTIIANYTNFKNQLRLELTKY